MVRVSLDANVLVYALDVDDRRNKRAIDIVRRAARGDCILTMQSLAECFVVLINKRGFSAQMACDEIYRFRRSIDYAAAYPVDFDEAMRAVVEYGMSFWDAMMWATAKRTGCRVMLTEDRQGRPTLEGVRFVNPFDSVNDQLIDGIFAVPEA